MFHGISLHVWAIAIAHSGSTFGISFMITQLPLYLSSVIGLNIKSNGFLSSLPYLTRFIGSNIINWLTTYLERKTKWKKKTWFRICSFLNYWNVGMIIKAIQNKYTTVALSTPYMSEDVSEVLVN
ncbi:putative inorganic phosphate cotransporter [Armadillidium nasatum]|uniref:Putative inorganic phosphate cotransporter n=1 Tax=Armadillidium nasatum TaxID=96803 RepID=A0A5N5T3Y6_9CRUS|nr:putative inorganic phosphate cotransporter [Armadillidium nasatum]